MELFSVNRYTTEKLDKEATSEAANLEKLLRKIEKKKIHRHEASAPTPQSATETEHDTRVKETQSVATEDTAADTEIENVQAEKPDENKSNALADGFQVLGEDVAHRKGQEVDMILPAWLAHPTIISTSVNIASDEEDAESALSSISYLAPYIKQTLKEMKINRLFPVQAAVIPWMLEAHSKPTPFRPRDICVSAPTGSGKTLAFAAPIVQLLANRVERKIRCLVVLPVTELAVQVYKVFDKLCKKTDLTVALLSKQLSLAEEQHKLVELYKDKYHSKVDILVTTPGRLVEHMHLTKGFCLKALKFLVIDEADRIMDAVFQNWLYHLDAHVREASDQLLAGRVAPLCYNELIQSVTTQPHKLLFSATLSQDPEKLQTLRLFQPKLFTSVQPKASHAVGEGEEGGENDVARGEFVGKYTTPAELTEKYCLTETKLKPITLCALIKQNGWNKFLCFTNSIQASSRLAFVLTELFKESDIDVRELSGSLTATKRAEVLSDFARGKINGLICSDALARGIDISDVDVVISYDPPRHIKTYIHRIGRTARAGRHGTAVALVNAKELTVLNEILATAGKTLKDEITASMTSEEDMSSKYSEALQQLKQKVEFEKRKVLIKKRHEDIKATLHKQPEQMSLIDRLKLEAIQKQEEHEIRKEVKVAPKRLRSKRDNKGKKAKLTKETS